jgi:hypothetical protein
MTSTRGEGFEEIADSSANILGSLSGALVGAAMAGHEGAIVGAVTGPVVEETGRRILSHALGFRERKRVDSVVRHTTLAVHRNQAAGMTLRRDHFWEARGGYVPPAQEVFEAVLLAAQRGPEERKVPFMGSLFAYAAFDDGLSASAAHWAVKTAESLTWSQFQLLALVGRAEELDLSGIVIGKSAPNWDSFTLHQELSNLGVGGRYLIHGGTEELWNKIEVPASVLQNYRLQNGGKLLHAALGLLDVPVNELEEVVGRLRKPESS